MKEAGVPRENPQGHWENMQTLNRKAQEFFFFFYLAFITECFMILFFLFYLHKQRAMFKTNFYSVTGYCFNPVSKMTSVIMISLT